MDSALPAMSANSFEESMGRIRVATMKSESNQFTRCPEISRETLTTEYNTQIPCVHLILFTTLLYAATGRRQSSVAAQQT